MKHYQEHYSSKSKYYENLQRAKREGYETAMHAWGLPDSLRLQFCIRIRETNSIPRIHEICEEIYAYENAVGLITSYKEAE